MGSKTLVGFFLEVVDPVPVNLDAAELLRNLKADIPRLSEELVTLLEKFRPLIEPKAVYACIRVIGLENDQVYLENGHTLRSVVLGDMLERAQEIVPYVITIGPKLENRASQESSLLRAWLLEKIADYALEKACAYVRSRTEERLRNGVSGFSPGSGTGELFGIEQQETLFRILDPATKIGVRLMPSYLMVPRKSESGVFAVTREEYVACEYCPRQCESRRAPFKGDYHHFKRT